MGEDDDDDDDDLAIEEPAVRSALGCPETELKDGAVKGVTQVVTRDWSKSSVTSSWTRWASLSCNDTSTFSYFFLR